MAQQIFDQYAPLAKVSANETIPVVAAIAQTRDGKDELLHGTVPFVSAGDLYVPVSAANRLPVEATLTGQVQYKTLKRYSDFQRFDNDGVVTLISDLDMAGVSEWWVVHRQNFAISIGDGVQYEAIFYHRPGEVSEDRTLEYYPDLMTGNVVGPYQGFTNPVRSFGRYMTLRVRNRTGTGGFIRHIELVLVRSGGGLS